MSGDERVSPRATPAQIAKMRPLAMIPNTPGFELIGITLGWTAIKCTVEVGPEGNIRLADGMYPYLQGWLPAPGHDWSLAYPVQGGAQ